MTAIAGTNITAPIRPYDTLDSIPTAIAEEIKGGWHSCADINERNNIPVARRTIGMVARVIGVGYFEWDGTTWNTLTIGGGSGTGITWNNIIANTNVLKDNGYFIDATTNTIDITLPASPTIGDAIRLIAINVNYTITILRNTKLLMGVAEDLTLANIGDGIHLVYSGTAFGWTPISELTSDEDFRLASQPVPWGELTNVPSTFPPTGHSTRHGINGDDVLTLAQSQITGLVAALAATIIDAPIDNVLYGRKNGVWQSITGGIATWGNINGTLTNQTDLVAVLATKLDKSGTSDLTITKSIPTINLRGDWSGISIGRIGNLASTPYIDFISGAVTPGSFDTRILASGGDGTNGGGILNFLCANLQWGGNTLVTASDARLTDNRYPTAHVHPESDITNLTTDLAAKINTSLIGANNGLATLDGSGKVTASQLPASGQPLDADLTAISALTTTGYARRSATDTWVLDTTIPWASLSSVPSTFIPTAHVHTESDITNLTTDLAAKLDKSGTSDLTITKSIPTINLRGDWAGISMGRIGNLASTPFIDFISGAVTPGSFDSRLVASGGDGTNGGGTLNFLCANLQWGGVIVAVVSDSRFTDSRYPTTHVHTESDITNLTTDLAARLTDAPSNGSYYGRKDGVWSVITGSTFNGGTITGDLIISKNDPSLKFLGTGTANIEFGCIDGVASTPFFDWHSGATAADYDVRMIVSGGNGSNGGGTLNIVSGTLQWNSSQIALTSDIAAKYDKAGGTITGDITITKADPFFALNGTGNAHMLIGRTDTTISTPYIDFKSSQYANGYDVRIMASSGGPVAGTGILDFSCFQLRWAGVNLATVNDIAALATNREVAAKVVQATDSRVRNPAVINYITNSDFEIDTTGWTTYADAANGSPVDGIGGGPNVTIARSTSSPLRGSASLVITKDAANRQGQGVSYNFSIDSVDVSRALNIYFDYILTGASVHTVYIYDVTGNILFIISNNAALTTSSTRFAASFIASANTSYRLIIHVSNPSAVASTLKIDNVYIGPMEINISPTVFFIARTASTQALTANTTNIIYGTVSSSFGGGYDAATGIFTCVIPGLYQFNFNGFLATGTPVFGLYKNGVYVDSGSTSSAATFGAGGGTLINLNIGDTIAIRSTVTGSLTASALSNRFSGARIG